MFLKFNHHELDVVKITRALVKECYTVTKSFPAEERYLLNSQIRRAAISVYLNLSEGCSRKSITERKRFFEISRGSVTEIDAAFDLADDLRYLINLDLTNLGNYMQRSYSMLCKMIKNL